MYIVTADNRAGQGRLAATLLETDKHTNDLHASFLA
jgi:hypothetical protein